MTHRPSSNSRAQHTELSSPCHTRLPRALCYVRDLSALLQRKTPYALISPCLHSCSSSLQECWSPPPPLFKVSPPPRYNVSRNPFLVFPRPPQQPSWLIQALAGFTLFFMCAICPWNVSFSRQGPCHFSHLDPSTPPSI